MVLRWCVERLVKGSDTATLEICVGPDVPQDFEQTEEDNLDWGEEIYGKLSVTMLRQRMTPTEGEVAIQVIEGDFDLTELREADDERSILDATMRLVVTPSKWIPFTRQARQMAKRVYSEALGL